MATATELPINTGTTALDMANEIFGSGMDVNTATYSGDADSSGTYSNGDAVSPFTTPGDTGVILSTSNANDFTNSDGSTNTNQSGGTSTNATGGIDGDADFNALAIGSSFDATFLEITFTPTGDTITLDFVLSSEEYPDFVNTQYNDVIGVWVNGTLATVSVGDGTASISNINSGETQNIFNDNLADQFNTEMDGFTVTLTFVAPVTPGAINTLKVGVADVGDSGYDTNFLIAGGSVHSTVIAKDDTIIFGKNDTIILDVLGNDSSTGGALTVTHLHGQAVVTSDPSNNSITLAKDKRLPSCPTERLKFRAMLTSRLSISTTQLKMRHTILTVPWSKSSKFHFSFQGLPLKRLMALS